MVLQLIEIRNTEEEKKKIGGGNQEYFVWLLIQVERPN